MQRKPLRQPGLLEEGRLPWRHPRLILHNSNLLRKLTAGIDASHMMEQGTKHLSDAAIAGCDPQKGPNATITVLIGGGKVRHTHLGQRIHNALRLHSHGQPIASLQMRSYPIHHPDISAQ